MAEQDRRTDGGRVPDDESMRGHPIIDRAEAIRVIRGEHDDLAMLVMFLTDALRDGMQLNHQHLRQQVAAKGRRALLERETALITLGGDDYQEPPEWDWEELLDAIANDVTIRDLERAFKDDESEDGEES
jgi:hypothetical protein